MLHTIIFDEQNKPNEQEKQQLIDFLHDQLEQYGDPKNQIERAIDYSLKEFTSFGGFVMLLKQEEELRAAVVINRTGMDGYIPENILVYIAVDRNKRGEGLGRKLMTQAIAHADGDIALHVEANNPAKRLYEKLGFTNPYLEMRLKKSK
ncbi:MAG: gcn5-related n-acetyltransferase [Proteiniphilum sp.]|jgi:ribosomal protein S18 acetylase RimI-like enzyme|nr:gcn5-related n-acetyltransferase [Proteiniphilum sp.]